MDTIKSVEELVEENQALAYYLLGKYGFLQNDMYYGDYESAALLGLYKAANTWDPSKGIKFSTYSGRCIMNEINMSIRNVKRHKTVTHSMDGEINFSSSKDSNNSSVDNYNFHKSSFDTADEAMYSIDLELVKGFLSTLGERERFIFEKYYGLYGENVGQVELAKELGISQSYVSRLAKKLASQLRERLSIGIAG